MNVLISGRVADSAAALESGRIEFAQAQRIDTGELLVTSSIAVAQVVAGELRKLDGSPFTLPANPDGTAVRIREVLGGQTFEWWAAVPDVSAIEYRELPIVESANVPESVWGPPPWLSEVQALRDETVAAIESGLEAAEALGGIAGINNAVNSANDAAAAAGDSAAVASAEADRAEAAAGSIDMTVINGRLDELGEELGGKADRGFRLSTDKAYRRRIIHNLVYEHADAAAARAAFGGSLFAQSFAIDEIAREVLVISQTPQIVSVYDWDTGVYKGIVYSLNRTGVTEGAAIVRESGRRYLYVVGSPGNVDRFDITNHPAKLSVAPVNKTYSVEAWNRLTYFNGMFTTGARSNEGGGTAAEFLSRGRLSRFDSSFRQVGMVDFPSSIGGGLGPFRTDLVPKTQAICEGPGFFAISIGGGWSAGVTETDYHMQGVRVITPGGEPIVDALVPGSKMMARLNEAGVGATHIENEGIAWTEGRLVSLYAVNSSSDAAAKTGGILIMEEFSDHPDAIDFSGDAKGFTVPDVKRMQSGQHPVGFDGIMRDMVTWAALDTIPKIVESMRNMGQHRLSFYTSAVSVSDARGKALPSGYLCEVLSASASTFMVRLTRNSTTGFMVWWNGTQWVQSNMTDWTDISEVGDGYEKLTGSNDRVAVSLNGNMVTLKVGLRAKAPATHIPAGNSVLIPANGIPEFFRPQQGHALFIGGNTSGPVLRVVVGSGGDLQVVGVPASTYTYISGVLLYPL